MPVMLRVPRQEEVPLLAERLALDGLLEVACPLDVSRDARVAELDGEVVGSCWVRVVSSITVFSADGSEAFCEGFVEPRHRGKGVGTALLWWAIGRAGAEPAVREVFTDASSDHAVPLLRSLGFQPDRSVRVLTHEDPGAVPAPRWPDGVRVVTSPRGDELVDMVVAACDAAFADLTGYRGATRPVVARVLAHPTTDPELCLIARRGTDVVGLNYCRLEPADGSLCGWVEDLGVAAGMRGIGLGRALLWEGIRQLADRGASSIVLGVDAENAPALRLYERTGFTLRGRLSRYRRSLDRSRSGTGREGGLGWYPPGDP